MTLSVSPTRSFSTGSQTIGCGDSLPREEDRGFGRVRRVLAGVRSALSTIEVEVRWYLGLSVVSLAFLTNLN